MNVSVVICTYNRSFHLRNVLATVFSQTVLEEIRWDIVVIDNNSSDNTPEIVKELAGVAPVALRYFREEQQGISHARNRGVREASGDYLVFIDDDALAAQGWLAAICRTMAETGCDCCGGRIHLKPDKPLPLWLKPELWGFLGYLDYGDTIRVLNTEYLFSGNMGLRKGVFETIRLFDPELGRKEKALTGGEEIDMQQRLRAAGGTFVYQPDALVYHVIGEWKLTKSYFRKLHYCEGLQVGKAYADHAAKKLCGVPLFIISHLGKSILKYLASPSVRKQMNVSWFLGFIRGRLDVRAM